jgi:hypothetical protein
MMAWIWVWLYVLLIALTVVAIATARPDKRSEVALKIIEMIFPWRRHR